jgi:hypothetical protein
MQNGIGYMNIKKDDESSMWEFRAQRPFKGRESYDIC